MMIYFYPAGGLANRMRAINSLLKVTKADSMLYRVIWQCNSELNCPFETIWQPCPTVVSTEKKYNRLILFKLRNRGGVIGRVLLRLLENLHLVRLYDTDDYGVLREDVQRGVLKKYRHVVIRTYSVFTEDKSLERDFFVLREDVRQLVDAACKDFNEETVGVHIRRTDNSWSIEQSPVELFTHTMQTMIAENPKRNFYLATDDVELKQTLIQTFAGHILSQDCPLNRDTQQGILSAVVEMYALSRTVFIIGSYYSSFSEMAAEIGGITLDVLHK